MRTRIVVVLSLLLLIPLLAPSGVWAKRITAQGSVTITGGTGPLTTQLVVTAVTANPGLEKSITQQLPLPGPLFVLPFFVDKEKDSPRQGDLETVLFLTNTTGAVLVVTLTLRDADGEILATSTPPSIPAHGTRTILLSDLLP